MAITCCHFRFYSHVTRLNLRIFREFANEIPWNSPFLPVKSQFCLVQWPWNRPRKAIPSLYLQCCSLTRREAAVSSRNWGWVPGDPTRDSSQESGNFSFFSPQNSWKPELNRLFIFEIWDEDSENKISTGIGCGYGYEYDQLMKQSILPSRQVGSDPLLIFWQSKHFLEPPLQRSSCHFYAAFYHRQPVDDPVTSLDSSHLVTGWAKVKPPQKIVSVANDAANDMANDIFWRFKNKAKNGVLQKKAASLWSSNMVFWKIRRSRDDLPLEFCD